jgi:hypothetical protein
VHDDHWAMHDARPLDDDNRANYTNRRRPDDDTGTPATAMMMTTAMTAAICARDTAGEQNCQSCQNRDSVHAPHKAGHMPLRIFSSLPAAV